MYRVELEKGYCVINNNGIVTVERSGEKDEIRNERYLGDRVVLMLMQRIEALESPEELADWDNTGI